MSVLLQNLGLVALGGAAGSVLRFVVSSGVAGAFGRAFPYGTLVVNTSGALAIGVLFVALSRGAQSAEAWRLLLMTGFLGGFTTFSAFSLETMQLIEAGAAGRALTNVAANVLLCLLACWLGMLLARQL